MSLESAINVAFPVVFVVCAAAALYARWKGRVALGLGWRGRPIRDLGLGLAIGTTAMTGTVVAILATGSARVHGIGFDLPLLGLGLGALAVDAFLEELAYRGLLFTGLSYLTRRPMLALALSAAIFGLVHLTGSPDATAIGVLSDALGGVMYAVAFVRTRRLWLPIGIHFSWNFVQATLLGFPASDNTTFSGAVLHVTSGSPVWLSGGGYGPEGSVISLGFRILVIVAVLLVTRAQWAGEDRTDPARRAGAGDAGRPG